MYLYFPKTCDPPIFVFVFGPDYCIHHMLFENHETFQEKKTIKLEIYTQMGSLTQTSALCELAPCIAILVRWQLELLCSSPDLNLHSGCVYWSPHSSTKVNARHAGHAIWRPKFNSRWLHQWLKNFSNMIPQQRSVNQLLGCLKIGLLPNRPGFISRSEQGFILCWVEVICKEKELYSRKPPPVLNPEFYPQQLKVKFCKCRSNPCIKLLTCY